MEHEITLLREDTMFHVEHAAKGVAMAKQAKKTRKRLGKGLGGLLSNPVTVPVENGGNLSKEDETKQVEPLQPAAEAAVLDSGDTQPFASEGILFLQIDSVEPNRLQPRQVFDDDSLSQLADSIQKAGVMQAIVVRKLDGEEGYELIAGERRLRAAQMAGLKTIPATIKNVDDRTAAEWALIENLQREDLNPIDRAEAFDRLIVKFEATQNEIAEQLGINRSSVSNFLRLNDLESSVKDAVRDGRLTMGHAKVLLSIPDVTKSRSVAARCMREQWSVRELERQLQKGGSKPKLMEKEKTPHDMYMDSLSEQIGNHLGTKVDIASGQKKGSGKLTITFYDNDQFEGILDKLQFKPVS